MAICAFALAAPATEAFGHGENHPAELRNSRNQFVYYKYQEPLRARPVLDEDGRLVDLGHFRGTLVLLNLWATWCLPCIVELPSLDRLQNLVRDESIAVLALSIDEGGEEGTVAFARRLGVRNLRLLIDVAESEQDQFPLYGLPITYLIDPDSQVIGYIVGAVEWDSAEAASFLRHYAASAAIETSNEQPTTRSVNHSLSPDQSQDGTRRRIDR